MSALTISEIANELNLRAHQFDIGSLPRLRSDLKSRRGLPNKIFTAKTIFDDYAFHHGGRQELQFNIGWEYFDGKKSLRYGVAFSLELNINLRTIDPLVPKILRFNEFLRLYGSEYADFRMWQYLGKERSQISSPAEIPAESVRAGVFVFLGKVQLVTALDYDSILKELDRLLPLYLFAESDATRGFPSLDAQQGFQFKEGHRSRATGTTMSVIGRQIDVVFRHAELQDLLVEILKKRGLRVGTENPSGNGGKIDAVVKLSDRSFWFYEIKVASSARACIREALAQLLEYAYWPGGQVAERLFIIGEPNADLETIEYLRILQKCFNLPIYYQKLDLQNGLLAAPVP